MIDSRALEAELWILYVAQEKADVLLHVVALKVFIGGPLQTLQQVYHCEFINAKKTCQNLNTRVHHSLCH